MGKHQTREEITQLRAKILAAIGAAEHRELTTSEIEKAVNADLFPSGSVTLQLRRLREAGIIRQRKPFVKRMPWDHPTNTGRAIWLLDDEVTK